MSELPFKLPVRRSKSSDLVAASRQDVFDADGKFVCQSADAATRDAIIAALNATATVERVVKALTLLIEELDDPCRRMPVCHWDDYEKAWRQDGIGHSVQLSLMLEKEARAAIEAMRGRE